METMPERSRTPCSTTVKRLSRTNRFRKTSGSLIPIKNNWESETLAHQQQTNSNYAGDFSSDHNLKLQKGKSSDDSIVDLNLTEQVDYPDYVNRKLCCNSREKPPRDFRYKIENPSCMIEDGDSGLQLVSPVNRSPHKESETDQFLTTCLGMPEGIIAEEKLKRLKELQRRREFTERYYSQEIRKLINDYYRISGNSGDSIAQKQDKTSGPKQKQLCTIAKSVPQATSGLLKALEPCGTMTTITRLDCGCMQETTRPIFTTSRGRVENRNCHHGQSPALLKLASSNPQEHLSSSNFMGNRQLLGLQHNSSGFIKHRPGKDPRIVQTRTSVPAVVDHNSSKRMLQASNSARCNLEIGKGRFRRPETASSSFIRDNAEIGRNLSPLRKYSDTNSTD